MDINGTFTKGKNDYEISLKSTFLHTVSTINKNPFEYLCKRVLSFHCLHVELFSPRHGELKTNLLIIMIQSLQHAKRLNQKIFVEMVRESSGFKVTNTFETLHGFCGAWNHNLILILILANTKYFLCLICLFNLH